MLETEKITVPLTHITCLDEQKKKTQVKQTILHEVINQIILVEK